MHICVPWLGEFAVVCGSGIEVGKMPVAIPMQKTDDAAPVARVQGLNISKNVFLGRQSGMEALAAGSMGSLTFVKPGFVHPSPDGDDSPSIPKRGALQVALFISLKA